MDSATQPGPAYAGKVKYTETQSRGYQIRKPAKHRAEMRLVERAFALIPTNLTVLDAPCGGGRVTIHLAQRGYHVTAADLSDAMITIARENIAQNHLSCAVEHQDIEKLTYPDQKFGAAISFRLFHHFPTVALRQQVITELCRVSARYVALSYFSPVSFTSLKRKLLGTDRDRFATPLREVVAYFQKSGFRLVQDFAQTPLIHTLHLAVFERQPVA